MHSRHDDFRKILDQYQIYSEVHAFPDSPHGFCLFEPWFTPTVDYIVGFFWKGVLTGWIRTFNLKDIV